MMLVNDRSKVNQVSDTSNVSESNTKKSELSLVSRIITLLTQELEKDEHKERIKTFVMTPALAELNNKFGHYVIMLLVLLLIIASTNLYLMWKLGFKTMQMPM